MSVFVSLKWNIQKEKQKDRRKKGKKVLILFHSYLHSS